VLFSAAEAFYAHAEQELKAVAPGARLRRLGPDLGVLEGDGAQIERLAARCRSEPVVFVRHLAQLAAHVATADADALVAAAVRVGTDAKLARLSLQAWASGVRGQHAEALRQRVARELTLAGVRVERRGAPQVLTLCLAADAARVGLNATSDALVDWPGGRVRLARRPEQLSRAEFKLEELLQVLELPLGGGVALDLGASPGGWTRLLRTLGYAVWAVDPAELAPSVAQDPGVRHFCETAGRFLGRCAQSFDLVANDARTAPRSSCDLLLQAAERLRADGLAIATLKISRRTEPAAVRALLRSLSPSYRIAFARQLFHNGDEVTLVARRS
jgi:23S rRNA (cytidine2498-2'-O)-methyltransferase